MDKERELEELEKLESELNIGKEQLELTDEIIEPAKAVEEEQEEIAVEEEFPGIEFIQQDDKKRSKRKYVIYQVVRALVVMIALFAFGYASYELTLVYLENQSTYATKDEISNMFLQDAENLPGGNIIYTSEGETIVMQNSSDGKAFVWDYEKMLEYNNSAVGYIRQDDGSYIDYPILQAHDNEYYLYHLPDHTWSSMGSIFLDYRIEGGLDADYAIVYGHYIGKRANNIMFGSLNWYWDWPNYHKEHPYFDIYVKERHYRYYVFSINKVPATGDRAYNPYFISDEERLQYLEDMKANSKYQFEQAPALTTDSKVIMLSTCTTDKQVRFIMFLVRGEEIYDVPGVDYENASSNLETTTKNDSTTSKDTSSEKTTTKKKDNTTTKKEQNTSASDATTSTQKPTASTIPGATKPTQTTTKPTSSSGSTTETTSKGETASSGGVTDPSEDTQAPSESPSDSTPESDSSSEDPSSSSGETESSAGESTEETGSSDEPGTGENSSEEMTTPME